MPNQEPTDTIPVKAMVDKATYEQLRLMAFLEGVSKAETIRRALTSYFEDNLKDEDVRLSA